MEDRNFFDCSHRILKPNMATELLSEEEAIVVYRFEKTFILRNYNRTIVLFFSPTHALALVIEISKAPDIKNCMLL